MAGKEVETEQIVEEEQNNEAEDSDEEKSRKQERQRREAIDFEKQKNLGEAMQYFEQLRIWGEIPHIKIYEKLIYLLGTLKDKDSILDHFHQMKFLGIIPSKNIYNILISVLATRGNSQQKRTIFNIIFMAEIYLSL